MKTKIIFIFCCMVVCRNQAQDYHFSQFDANPFYVNPALTGERLTDNKGIQFNACYRDQLAQYSKYPGSYRSIAAGIDEPVNSKFSLGQFFYDDKSAKSGFDTFGFLMSVSHKIIDQNADTKSRHNLSVGLQFGFYNKTLFPERFTYDVQYSSDMVDGFDRRVSNGETFARQSFYNFAANFGIYYRGISKNKRITGFGGFSIYNINKPNQSFYGDNAYSALPLRFNLHGGLLIVAKKDLTINPQVLYMNQATATELNIGILFNSKIEGSGFEPIYGISLRNKDALIFQIGVSYKDITVRASYDAVINFQKAYGNQGFEFSLVSVFRKRGQRVKIAAADSTLVPSEK